LDFGRAAVLCDLQRGACLALNVSLPYACSVFALLTQFTALE